MSLAYKSSPFLPSRKFSYVDNRVETSQYHRHIHQITQVCTGRSCLPHPHHEQRKPSRRCVDRMERREMGIGPSGPTIRPVIISGTKVRSEQSSGTRRAMRPRNSRQSCDCECHDNTSCKYDMCVSRARRMIVEGDNQQTESRPREV